MTTEDPPLAAAPAETLTGERVRLRLVRPGDGDRLEAILREPEVARWWGGADGDATRVRRELFEDGESVSYAIELEGATIGLVQYSEETDPDYRHAGIDIFLGAEHQGRGLGSEAIRVLARHLVGDRGHHRLTIDPAAANERAIRAYERVGFRRVGVLRQYERGPDGWRDGLLLDLLAAELRDR